MSTPLPSGLVLAGAVRQEVIKEIQMVKEKVKVYILVDDMILYIKNTKDPEKSIN